MAVETHPDTLSTPSASQSCQANQIHNRDCVHSERASCTKSLRGSHSTVRRTNLRNTPSDNQNKSRFRSQKLRHGRLAARRTYAAATGYVFDLTELAHVITDNNVSLRGFSPKIRQ